MDYYKDVTKKDGRVLRTGGPRDVQRKQRMDRDYPHVIEILKEQISDLQKQISNPTSTTGLSAEQMDHEIRKAVRETKAYYENLIEKANKKEAILSEKLFNVEKESTKRLNNEVERYRAAFNEKAKGLEEKYNSTISKLEDQLKLAEEKLLIKDELVDSLRAEKEATIKRLIEEQTKKMEELTRSIAYNQANVDEESDRPKMEDVFIDPLEEGAGKDLSPHIDIEDVSAEEKEDIRDKVDKLRSIMGGLKS